MSRAYESHNLFDWGSYFMWLCEKIDIADEGNRLDWFCLARTLMDIEFYSNVKDDQNRIDDAKELRAEFSQEEWSSIFDTTDTPVSVLEVLVALSIRMERDIVGEPGNDDPAKWFWIMMDNLGISIYSDKHFNRPAIVRKILTWLNRQYESNGTGGIFPLNNPYGDQRNVELWSQMQQFLTENFIY